MDTSRERAKTLSRFESHFRERVVEFQREYLIFTVCAVVLSLALMAGFAAVLFFLLADYLLEMDGTSWIRPFLAAYVILFVVIGTIQYRHRPAAHPGSSWDEMWTHLPRGSSHIWLGYRGEAGLFFLILTFPGLVFHFVAEFFKGRDLLASEEVMELAFEILVQGEKIPSEFLQSRLQVHAARFQRAIMLLFEMKLVIPSRADRGGLLWSIEGIKLMEDNSRPV